MRERTIQWAVIALSAVLVTGLAAGCSGQATASPEAALAATTTVAPLVSATGEVVPVQWTTLSFALGGRVAEVPAQEGDVIETGQVIARLDTSDLDAAVAQAQADLASAQANLTKVQAGPTADQIDAAQQAVYAANARTVAAVARRDALTSSVTEDQIASAESQVVSAQIQRDEMYKQLTGLQAYTPRRCLAFEEKDLPCPLGEYETVEKAYNLAETQLEAAQALVDELKRGPNADLVRVQNAQIWAASAQTAAAQAQLDLLRAQPFAEDVAAAQAQVAQAQAGVDQALAQLAQADLKAPFDGTVSSLNVDVGEFVAPGQPITDLGDLTDLQIETTDLSEIDVARVKVGSRVTVTFDALPDAQVEGTVIRIAPRASEGTGVNYTTVIKLDQIPDGLRWGMTAFVDIEVD
jgi:HlyD family secretion protein